jgi:hypothetical protein
MPFEKTSDQTNAEKILRAAREKEIADVLASNKTPDAGMLHDALCIYDDQKTAHRIIDRMRQDPTAQPLQQTFTYAAQFLGDKWVKELRTAATKPADELRTKAVRRNPRGPGAA